MRSLSYTVAILFNPLWLMEKLTFFATFDGNDGVIRVGSNVIAEVTEFSVNETAETKDDSAMGDTSRSRKSGMKDWLGSITCHWDDTDALGQEAMTVGAEVSLELYAEGTATGEDKKSGSAIITSVGVTNNKDGITQRSFSFEGNGALTHGAAA